MIIHRALPKFQEKLQTGSSLFDKLIDRINSGVSDRAARLQISDIYFLYTEVIYKIWAHLIFGEKAD